ncbi:MAG TPA: zinc ribbon domain-containing protein [Pyrinomonadaceae bacterium]|nr:zinc ribbon domain-containing protein [Pyrinomonadaceae bacterium]
MYCPECGTESQKGIQYCRVCGTNLKPLEKLDKLESINRPLISFGKRKTRAEKREDHISKGVVSLFSGVGLGVFLYFLSAALVLKLPPEIVAQVPFEIEPVMKMIWLFGLLPATSGVGHIIAGLLIRPRPEPEQLEQASERPTLNVAPVSITDHTTNLLTNSTKST